MCLENTQNLSIFVKENKIETMSTFYGIPTGVSAKLPYQPSIDEIYYVEGKHTIKIDRWRIEYFSDAIKEYLINPIESTEGYFALIVRLLDDSSLWDGFSEEQQRDIKSEIIDNFCFFDHIDSCREITPSLFIYHSKLKDGRYRFQQFAIGNKGIWETIKEAFAYMDYKDRIHGHEYEQQPGFPWGRDEIVQQMQQCAHQLIEIGMDEDEIRENLFSSRQIQDLVITKNGNIELAGWSTTKIKLSPLDKAVYLLFLRHPEGINFSYLPDYREELMGIYKKLMNYRTTASMQKSVEDVTDPTKNSINEKCARIRRAFIDVLGNYLASSYYITGNRGETKKIVLDRKHVRWEYE